MRNGMENGTAGKRSELVLNEIQFSEDLGFSINAARISGKVANALFCSGRAALSVLATDELCALGYDAVSNDPAEMEAVVDGWGFVSALEGAGMNPARTGCARPWVRGHGLQPLVLGGVE